MNNNERRNAGRSPKYNEDGSEKSIPSSWTYTASFLNHIAACAKADGLTPTVWVKMILIAALKERGFWPIPEPTTEKK